MSCWAVVPIKARAHCKRRLASVLDAPARIDLARRMLDHVLRVATAARGVDRVLVVSPERDSVAPDIPVVSDLGIGLNAAIELALGTARAEGAREIVVLPADLPRLEEIDLDELIDAGRTGGIAIASDRARQGTNGLYLGPGTTLALQFGPRSLEAHVAGARALGVDARVLHLPGFELDVDTPADLQHVAAVGRSATVRAGAVYPTAAGAS